MRGAYKQSLEHEQIKGTGWDEKHIPTNRSSSHTHQGRTASSPDAAGDGALNTNKPDEKPELL